MSLYLGGRKKNFLFSYIFFPKSNQGGETRIQNLVLYS